MIPDRIKEQLLDEGLSLIKEWSQEDDDGAMYIIKQLGRMYEVRIKEKHLDAFLSGVRMGRYLEKQQEMSV